MDRLQTGEVASHPAREASSQGLCEQAGRGGAAAAHGVGLGVMVKQALASVRLLGTVPETIAMAAAD